MKKILLTMTLATLCAVSAHAGLYVKPGAKCDVSSRSRFGTPTVVYNGPEYQEVTYLIAEDHVHGYIQFQIKGDDRYYFTDFENLYETQN
jgi:hypothetical protein